MSDRVRSRQRGAGTATKAPAATQRNRAMVTPTRTRQEKRAAAKAAAEARARAARRRRRNRTVGLTALAVVVLAGLGFWIFGRGGAHHAAAPRSASSASPASSSTAFPPLPAGADPALATKPTVTAGSGTPSKLNVTTLIPGTGPETKSGQTITVNYVGVSYQTGAEFDSSWSRSQTFDFQLGAGNVIKGWDQGLVGVKVGSRVQLDIPADLAYGDTSSNGSPSGPLRFVVDVLAAR